MEAGCSLLCDVQRLPAELLRQLSTAAGKMVAQLHADPSSVELCEQAEFVVLERGCKLRTVVMARRHARCLLVCCLSRDSAPQSAGQLLARLRLLL